VLNRLRRSIAQRQTARRVRAAQAKAAPPAKQEPSVRRLPKGMRKADVQEVLRLARLSFVQMQAAWDRNDVSAMGTLAMAPLLEDLRCQLDARGPGPNHTEVLQLEARLLTLEELGDAFVASVEFRGLIKEQHEVPASPFRELWLLANVKSAGRGWQLAQVQSLS